MNTKNLIETLKNNLDKSLLFEYLPNKLIKSNYHITEIKNINIASVDCGGKQNTWNETIIQLWENPLEIYKTSYMNTNKALEIIERVNAIKPIELEAVLKFEYGNGDFHTANLLVHEIIEENNSVIVKLHQDKTQCKASDQCCSPKEKQAVGSQKEVCC